MVAHVALSHRAHAAQAEAVLDPSCPNAPSHPDVLFPGNEDLRGHLLRSVLPAAHTLVNQSESLDTVSHL